MTPKHEVNDKLLLKYFLTTGGNNTHTTYILLTVDSIWKSLCKIT